MIESIGKKIIGFFATLGSYSLLAGQFFKSLFKKDFPVKETIKQLAKIGYESLPVIIITSLFTGMVLAFQTGSYMETKIKGIARFLPIGIAISMVRELGPMLTSLLVAGRSGSAIAAEIGTMRVTEQVDALVTLATNPIQYLLVPRIVAGVFAFPLLVIFSDLMGILGGSLVAKLALSQPFTIYFDSIASVIAFGSVAHGLIKSAIFGFLVIFLSCAHGYRVQGGAEAVGKATTAAVVSGSMSIFIADYILTSIIP